MESSPASSKNNHHRNHNPKLHKVEHNEDEEDPPHSISIDVPLICSNRHKNSSQVESKVQVVQQPGASKVPVMSFSAISPVNVEDNTAVQNTDSVLQVKGCIVSALDS